MTRLTKILMLIFVGGLLSACATLQPEKVAEECAATDWERSGVNDGKLGVTTASRASRFDDCATVGQPVDLGPKHVELLLHPWVGRRIGKNDDRPRNPKKTVQGQVFGFDDAARHGGLVRVIRGRRGRGKTKRRKGEGE